MPPLDWGQHIIDDLMEIGPVKSGGMGAVAIEQLDVWAWQQNQGIELDGWTCKEIIKLSRTYAAGLHEFSKPHAKRPWGQDAAENQQLKNAKMSSFFAYLKGREASKR